MAGTVYILELNNMQYYIGSTNDIHRRLLEHNSGKTLGIKYKLPAKLVFQQNFDDLISARRIELRLKDIKIKILLNK
jgi:putative endonuclease